MSDPSQEAYAVASGEQWRTALDSSANFAMHYNFALPQRPSLHAGPVSLKQNASVSKFNLAELWSHGQSLEPNFPHVPRWFRKFYRGLFFQELCSQLLRVLFIVRAAWRSYTTGVDQAVYLQCWSIIWLILNNVILGVALGRFLRDYNAAIGILLDSAAQQGLISWVHRIVIWLDSWPAGLKLNTELSHFYSRLFLFVIVEWDALLQRIIPLLPTVVRLMGLASWCGLTLSLAFASDLLQIATLHFHISYVITATTYQHCFKMVRSLWNLFRGKRYNTLHKRVDSWAYDVDQLLLGTILFTLIAFLLPTIISYYALFVCVHLLVVILVNTFRILITLMNHFPLFALILWIKDPSRLPGTVYLENSNSNPNLISFKTEPISLGSILQSWNGWLYIRSLFDAQKILSGVLYGDNLNVF